MKMNDQKFRDEVRKLDIRRCGKCGLLPFIRIEQYNLFSVACNCRWPFSDGMSCLTLRAAVDYWNTEQETHSAKIPNVD